MKSIMPCLWFAENAEEAAEFYVSLFSNSKIMGKSYYTEEGPLPAGTLLTVSLKLFGQDFLILNGGPLDTFNHSVSFIAPCDTQAEIDEIWDKILKNGGTPEACGWICDKYALCWQVVPAIFEEWLQDKDKKKVNAFMKEMRTQVKLDLAKLKAAYDKG